MSSIGTLEANVVAKTDQLEKGMKKAGDSLRGFNRDAEVSSNRAARDFDRMGKGFGTSMGELSKATRVGVAGLALLSQAGNETAGQLGQVAGGIITGFAAGGPVGAAIAGVTSLFGLYSRSVSDARIETEKLAKASAARIEKERADAEARATSQADYVQGLREAVELARVANSPAGTRRVQRDQAVAEGFRRGGSAGASTARELADLNEKNRLEKESADRIERAMEADRALGKAEAERRTGLRKEAEEAVRRGALTEEQLKHDAERQKILELQKAGLAEQARAMQALLDLTIAREKAEASAAQKVKDGAEAMRRAKEQEARWEKEAADAAVKRREADRLAAEQRKADAEVAHKVMLDQADAWRQQQQFAQKAPVERLDSRDPTAGWQAGSAMGPLALAREAKRQARQNERFQRHADNLGAESRERMGLIDAGWSAPRADDPARKSRKFTGPGGLVRNDDGSVWEPDAGVDGINARAPRGGSSVPNGMGLAPVLTESGTAPPTDGRMGEAARSFDAAKSAMAAATEAAGRLGDAAKGAADTIDEAGGKLAEGLGEVGGMAEKVTQFGTKVVEVVGEVSTVVADLKSRLDTYMSQLTQAAQLAGP